MPEKRIALKDICNFGVDNPAFGELFYRFAFFKRWIKLN